MSTRAAHERSISSSGGAALFGGLGQTGPARVIGLAPVAALSGRSGVMQLPATQSHARAEKKSGIR